MITDYIGGEGSAETPKNDYVIYGWPLTKIELWAPYTHWHVVLKGEVDMRQKAKSRTDYCPAAFSISSHILITIITLQKIVMIKRTYRVSCIEGFSGSRTGSTLICRIPPPHPRCLVRSWAAAVSDERRGVDWRADIAQSVRFHEEKHPVHRHLPYQDAEKDDHRLDDDVGYFREALQKH